MKNQELKIIISALDNTREAVNSVKSGFDKIANGVTGLAIKLGSIGYLARTAFNSISSAISPAYQAVEKFTLSVTKMAAILSSFQAGEDLAENFQRSKQYAEALLLKLEEVDAKTVASAQDLSLITEEMIKQGIGLIGQSREAELKALYEKPKEMSEREWSQRRFLSDKVTQQEALKHDYRSKFTIERFLRLYEKDGIPGLGSGAAAWRSFGPNGGARARALLLDIASTSLHGETGAAFGKEEKITQDDILQGTFTEKQTFRQLRDYYNKVNNSLAAAFAAVDPAVLKKWEDQQRILFNRGEGGVIGSSSMLTPLE